MVLKIRNLLPAYFEESRKNDSDIWEKELVFAKGDIIQIIAPSGSGKTSLIHFLYGARKEYKGEISYGDKDISRFDAEDFSDWRKNHISIVFQDLRLFPDQTVYDNIEIKRQLNPFHPAEKIMEMAGALGIADKLKNRCEICSYGEQQRIAIVRAMMQPFDFLLLDEPFSHLDEANTQKATSLILEESRRRNACILFADLRQRELFPFNHLFHL